MKSELAISLEEFIDQDTSSVEKNLGVPDFHEKNVVDRPKDVRELVSTEHGLRELSHNGLASFLSRSQKSAISKWMLRGAMLCALFSAETAFAEIVGQGDGDQDDAGVENNLEVPESIPESSFQVLNSFFDLPEANIFVLSENGRQGSFRNYNNYSGRISGSPVLSEKNRLSVAFKSYLSPEQLRANLSREQLELVNNSEDSIIRLSVGEGSSKLWMCITKTSDSNWLVELGYLAQNIFAKKGEKPKYIPIPPIDLKVFGLGKVEGVFYSKELPQVAELSDCSIYADGIPEQEAQKIIDKYGKQIEDGIRRATGLFNQENFHPKVVLRLGRKTLNADARPEINAINIDVNYFLDTKYTEDDNVLQGLDPEAQIENTLAHESLHLLDSLFGEISEDGVLEQLFLSTPTEILDALSEDNISDKKYQGGHADFSAPELFISTLNALSNGSVRLNLASRSKEVQELYLKVIIFAENKLKEKAKNHPELAGAPIFKLLADQRVYVKSLLAGEKPKDAQNEKK